MNRAILFIVAFVFASPVFAQTTQPVDEAKTGAFAVTFTQRSPLSEMKSLTKRLKIANATADYDLNKFPFLVYVPESFDPQKPMGLIVLSNYKHSDDLPRSVFPQLKDANVAFIVSKELAPEAWQKAGLALDAVFNMQQRYPIDRRRVYSFSGSDQNPGGRPIAVAEWLGLNYPEVFTGSLSVGVNSYRPIKAANNGSWPAETPHPDAVQFGQAKQHPFIFALFEQGDQWKRFADAFTQDGFKFVKYTQITQEQWHYPLYTTDWLPDMLKYLDDATAKLKMPATQSSKPHTP